jgi:hypothetical protein
VPVHSTTETAPDPDITMVSDLKQCLYDILSPLIPEFCLYSTHLSHSLPFTHLSAKDVACPLFNLELRPLSTFYTETSFTPSNVSAFSLCLLISLAL